MKLKLSNNTELCQVYFEGNTPFSSYWLDSNPYINVVLSKYIVYKGTYLLFIPLHSYKRNFSNKICL